MSLDGLAAKQGWAETYLRRHPDRSPTGGDVEAAWNSLGVWWNDRGGSTHLISWNDVLDEIAASLPDCDGGGTDD